jgi:uncharacterized protein YjdB
MNITSASIGSGGTLNVQYEPNTTGAITGWTITPESGRNDWESREIITIRFTPQFSGTVLTETFTVSGVDDAGIQRSDSSVLRQGFDTNLQHYIDGRFGWSGMIVNSSAFTENYIEFNATLYGNVPDNPNYCSVFLYSGSSGYDVIARWTGYIDTTPPGPDTGTVASSVTIVVADTITDSGQASAIYSPSDAYVNLVYSSSDTSKATIDPSTGAITVLEDGSVTICVEDQISGLQDCKTISVYKEAPGPDTGTTATAITINVADTITDTGFATTTIEPVGATVDLHYTSSSPEYATIDPITGEITVLQTGSVTFCVNDTVSSLSSCKNVNVVKSGSDTGSTATAITINVESVITDLGYATATVYPSTAQRTLHYTSSDSTIATITDSGAITVLQSGSVTFCVEELNTHLTDCKLVSVVKSTVPTDKLIVTYNVTEANRYTDILTNRNEYPLFSRVQLENGTDIDINYGQYIFGSTGNHKIYYTLTSSVIPGGYFNLLSYYDSNGRAHINRIVSVEVPEGVTAIGLENEPSGVFSHCENLKSITLPSTLRSIGRLAFFCCAGLNNITIPSGVTEIGEGAFGLCTFLRSINIPSGVTSIPDQCFPGCRSLRSITIPDNITSIGDNAFSVTQISTTYPGISTLDGKYSCGLTAVTIPSSVTFIGKGAFAGDANECKLTRMTFVGTTPPTLGDDSYALGDSSNSFPIYVPCDYVSTYRTAYIKYRTRITCPNIATGLTLSIDSATVVNTGQAYAIYSPSNAYVNLVFESSNPEVASINSSGEITVHQNYPWVVQFSVRDTISGLYATKAVNVAYTDTNNYLTFEIVTSGTIKWYNSSPYYGHSIEYNKNAGGWTSIRSTSGSATPTITANAGDVIQFRGNNTSYYSGAGDTSYSKFSSTASYNIRGNIMSLIQSENFDTATTLADRAFYGMFGGENIIDASNLLLPATSLGKYCYYNLFNQCYSLTAAPVLPATVLSEGCYQRLFYNCYNLNNIKCLAETNITTGNCRDWLAYVSNTGTFTKSPNATWTTGGSGIPSGWTVVDAS